MKDTILVVLVSTEVASVERHVSRGCPTRQDIIFGKGHPFEKALSSSHDGLGFSCSPGDGF